MPTSRTSALRRLSTAAAVAILGSAAVTACGPADKPTGRPSAAASSATPTVDARTAAAIQAATAAYQGYVAAYAAAAQAANPDDPNLARYLADPLLSLTRHNVRQLKDNGQVQLGAQTARIVSTQADLTGKAPTVTIHSCLDYSDLRLVYKKDHRPVPGSSLSQTQLAAVATVTQYPGGRWLVSDTKREERAC